MSTNPLSASEPWNLVADGYAETTVLVFEEFANLKSQFVTSNWCSICTAPWLEETLPTLKRPLTSDAWLGVWVK